MTVADKLKDMGKEPVKMESGAYNPRNFFSAPNEEAFLALAKNCKTVVHVDRMDLEINGETIDREAYFCSDGALVYMFVAKGE